MLRRSCACLVAGDDRAGDTHALRAETQQALKVLECQSNRALCVDPINRSVNGRRQPIVV